MICNQKITLPNQPQDIYHVFLKKKDQWGASGDLTPRLLAAALIGRRDVIYKGEVRPTSDVYQS